MMRRSAVADLLEDLLDQLDTMAEQIDPEFRKSLQQSMEEYRRGDVGTMEDIRRILRRKDKGRARPLPRKKAARRRDRSVADSRR